VPAGGGGGACPPGVRFLYLFLLPTFLATDSSLMSAAEALHMCTVLFSVLSAQNWTVEEGFEATADEKEEEEEEEEARMQ
jgi:hypothetical protein